MGCEIQASGQSQNETPARMSQPRRRFWLPFSAGRVWVILLLFGTTVFVLGMALDWFLVHQTGLQPLVAALVLNALFGVVAGFLVHRLLAFERDKYDRILKRLQVVDEMNHHIRNALQVISFSAHGASSESELSEIRNAVTRIQWAVREILPKVEPEFSPFEGPAKPADARPDLNTPAQK